MKFFSFEGGFTRLTEKLFDLFLLGLLWLVCSLPVITAGAASAALYRTVVKVVKKNEGYAFKGFFRVFRENFRKATALWLAVLSAGLLLQLNIAIIMGETDGELGLFFVCLYYFVFALLIPFFLYGIAVITGFGKKWLWDMKISAYMMFRYLPVTLAMWAAVFCFGAFVYRFPILILVLPGPFAFVISDFIERAVEKMV